jgi:hypothetical protein
MSQLLDKLAVVRGLPVLVGLVLVILNFVVQCVAHAAMSGASEPGWLLFLFTDGNLLLHLGVIVAILGMLIGDIL